MLFFSQSFTQRHCSNNQSPCPNMLIHLLHPYSHGHWLLSAGLSWAWTHTQHVSSIRELLQTNSPSWIFKCRSDNTAGTINAVGKERLDFPSGNDNKQAVEPRGFLLSFPLFSGINRTQHLDELILYINEQPATNRNLFLHRLQHWRHSVAERRSVLTANICGCNADVWTCKSFEVAGRRGSY